MTTTFSIENMVDMEGTKMITIGDLYPELMDIAIKSKK